MLDFVQERVPKIEKEMEKAVPRNREPKEVYSLVWDFIDRGGKRFRPVMCLLSCEAVGGKEKDAIGAAVAVELFHSFTLLHDDICDDSELRRGKPCLHRIYGIPLAMNAGDGLFMMVFESIFEMHAAPEKKLEIQKMLTKSFSRVLEGQAIELGWYNENKWDMSEEDYLRMAGGKTGSLIGAACEVGAYLGGGTKEQQRILRKFGEAVGIAFQIQDDILNLIGEEDKYMKEIGGDITEGKRTIMVLHTLKHCNELEKRKLIGALNSHTRNKFLIQWAIEIMKRHGSFEYAKRMAQKMVKNAKNGVEKLPKTDAREKLLEVADFLIDRDV